MITDQYITGAFEQMSYSEKQLYAEVASEISLMRISGFDNKIPELVATLIVQVHRLQNDVNEALRKLT